MVDDPKPKPLIWVSSSRKNFSDFPDGVKSEMGYGLYQAQLGKRHRNAKTLSGFGGAGVVEIIDDHKGDTFRTVYTVRFASSQHVSPPRSLLRAPSCRDGAATNSSLPCSSTAPMFPRAWKT